MRREHSRPEGVQSLAAQHLRRSGAEQPVAVALNQKKRNKQHTEKVRYKKIVCEKERNAPNFAKCGLTEERDTQVMQVMQVTQVKQVKQVRCRCGRVSSG